MQQESDRFDKMLLALPTNNTKRTAWCVATTIFAFILLFILLRVKFAGKRIFCIMYALLIVAMAIVFYNSHMPSALRFTHTN